MAAFSAFMSGGNRIATSTTGSPQQRNRARNKERVLFTEHATKIQSSLKKPPHRSASLSALKNHRSASLSTLKTTAAQSAFMSGGNRIAEMAAFTAFMSGGARKFQSLTDLYTGKGSMEALAQSKEHLYRNISNVKLWTDAYVHTPEDVTLAIELRDKNQWTASFTTGKSNPKAGKMKEISDKACPPLRLQFKRISEIVEVKKKPATIGQQQEEGEQEGNDTAEALR